MIANYLNAKSAAIAGVVVVLLLVAAFFFGRATGKDHCQASTVKTLAKAQKALDKATKAWAARDAELAAQDIIRDTEFREIIREVPTIVERPVYGASCLDADGLQLIRRGVAAANAGAPGGVDGNASDVR